MIRALTTLVGLAAAAAILYFVTDVGDGGGSLWLYGAVWAGAGLVVGVLYQGGGRRAPGMRTNAPLLIVAFLPWTVLTAALIAVQANKPVWLADRGRDLLPNAWIDRWEVSLPAFALVAGLLLAFSLLEPRIGIRDTPPAVDSTTAPIEAYTPYVPPEPVDTPLTAVQPVVGPEAETVVTHERQAIDEPPTTRLLSDGDTSEPENPVQVIHPERASHDDA